MTEDPFDLDASISHALAVPPGLAPSPQLVERVMREVAGDAQAMRLPWLRLTLASVAAAVAVVTSLASGLAPDLAPVPAQPGVVVLAVASAAVLLGRLADTVAG